MDYLKKKKIQINNDNWVQLSLLICIIFNMKLTNLEMLIILLFSNIYFKIIKKIKKKSKNSEWQTLMCCNISSEESEQKEQIQQIRVC